MFKVKYHSSLVKKKRFVDHLFESFAFRFAFEERSAFECTSSRRRPGERLAWRFSEKTDTSSRQEEDASVSGQIHATGTFE